LSHFGTKNYKLLKEYLAKWIAKRIKEKNKGEVVEILKV